MKYIVEVNIPIEEMVKERNEIKDIMKLLDKCVSLNPMCKAEVATIIYGNNYRKIPEDSVVLSKEEYEKLKHFEYRVRSGVCMTQEEWFDFCSEYSNRRTCLRIEERERERKETAEKIYTKIKDSFLMNSNNRYALKLWIEEQFGVEIKE